MSESKQTNEEKVNAQDVVLDLNFVPQWAKKPPGKNHYEYQDEERRSSRRHDRYSSTSQTRRTDNRRTSHRDSDRGSRTPRATREPIKTLPIKISFLPEQKYLASVVRQIHHSRRAYPLMDLAHIFIQNKDGYLVKVETNPEAKADFSLFQCKQCKSVASSEEQMLKHILSTHLTDFYVREEIESEPPAGQFVCVARCRKSGVLLGPPNHHSYTDQLNELHQNRFAHLSIEQFKQQIETVHDEELIEKWKEESRKKVLYRPKGKEEEEPVSLRKAEADLRQRAPKMFERVTRAVFPAQVAQNVEDPNVAAMIRQAWTKENRFPLSLSFAMRAAFRHMHLYLFKAGKINFVTHIKPKPIQPGKTVENIAEVLLFLEDHAGSTRKQLLEVLHPSLSPDSPEAKAALQPLSWLIERGHIIEFFNGTLSVPRGRR
jgi:hypothetical protein